MECPNVFLFVCTVIRILRFKRTFYYFSDELFCASLFLHFPVDNEFGGTSVEPLTIYAQNGFLDLNMTESNSSLRHGTVYCTDDYSKSCSINQVTSAYGREEWICDTNGSSTCNTGTPGFFTEFWIPMVFCYHSYHLGHFSSPTACAHYAMEEESWICNGDQIMWSDSYADEWGCYCCQNGSLFNWNEHWNTYRYGIDTTLLTTTTTTEPIGDPIAPPPVPAVTLRPATASPTYQSPPLDSNPTSNPTMDPIVEYNVFDSTETIINSDTNSEDEIDIDLAEIDDDTTTITPDSSMETTVNVEIADVTSRDTFQWNIHYTIYAVLAACFVSSLGFGIIVWMVNFRGKANQIAAEEGIVEGIATVANLNDHPSLNPNSSKFVPGKLHPSARADDNQSTDSMWDVQVPTRMESVVQVSNTPSSLESVIPQREPELEGQTTGDDV